MERNLHPLFSWLNGTDAGWSEWSVSGCVNPFTGKFVFSRFLSFLIVSFWLVMTGLLMRAIWFPADSRLDVVSPGAVFRLIAARDEASHLDIYDDRKVVGKLNITPTSRQLPGDKREVSMDLSGNLNLRGGILAAGQLSLKGNFVLSHEGDLKGMDLKIQVKSPAMELRLKQAAGEEDPLITFTVGGMKVMDTSEKNQMGEGRGENTAFAGLLLGLVGISSGELDSMRQQAAAEAAATTLDARQGEFDLQGSAHRGYILSVRKAGKTSFRFCVENTGQIVSIETPTSYHLLTDELNGGAP